MDSHPKWVIMSTSFLFYWRVFWKQQPSNWMKWNNMKQKCVITFLLNRSGNIGGSKRETLLFNWNSYSMNLCTMSAHRVRTTQHGIAITESVCKHSCAHCTYSTWEVCTMSTRTAWLMTFNLPYILFLFFFSFFHFFIQVYKWMLFNSSFAWMWRVTMAGGEAKCANNRERIYHRHCVSDEPHRLNICSPVQKKKKKFIKCKYEYNCMILGSFARKWRRNRMWTWTWPYKRLCLSFGFGHNTRAYRHSLMAGLTELCKRWLTFHCSLRGARRERPSEIGKK